MSNKSDIVTIDGPSGVGKSTISRRVATALGYTYLDTGAMYRAVGLQMQRNQIDLQDEQAVQKCLDGVEIDLSPAQHEEGEVGVILCGEDVSSEVRTPEMSMVASKVSAVGLVRQKLTEMQRLIGLQGKIVAEGRDTGTVVFPDAAYKFYLDAQPEERARRRVLQLRQQGTEVDEQEILAMIITRDRNDSEREIAPLKKAEDASFVDTTHITIDETQQQILDIIEQKSRA